MDGCPTSAATGELAFIRVGSVSADGALNTNGWRQLLPLRGGCMNLARYLDSRNDFSKCSKALAVLIAFAAKIELRLVTDAYKEIVLRRVGSISCPRDCAVDVAETRVTRPFEADGKQKLISLCWIGRGLDHFDFNFVGLLICEFNAAVKCAVRVRSLVHVVQEVFHCYRRAFGIEFKLDVAQLSLYENVRFVGDRRHSPFEARRLRRVVSGQVCAVRDHALHRLPVPPWDLAENLHAKLRQLGIILL